MHREPPAAVQPSSTARADRPPDRPQRGPRRIAAVKDQPPWHGHPAWTQRQQQRRAAEIPVGSNARDGVPSVRKDQHDGRRSCRAGQAGTAAGAGVPHLPPAVEPHDRYGGQQRAKRDLPRPVAGGHGGETGSGKQEQRDQFGRKRGAERTAWPACTASAQDGGGPAGAGFRRGGRQACRWCRQSRSCSSPPRRSSYRAPYWPRNPGRTRDPGRRG